MDLKSMRERAGMKQSELARISGVNLRSLQDYEQGHKNIYTAKGETLLRLSLALGYSVEDILEGHSIDTEGILNRRETMNKRIIAYERLIRERKTKEVHFPVIEADESVDMSRIYPTRQVFVKKVISSLREDERVKAMYLFGSSITMACHKDSDIDFAVNVNGASKETLNDISEKIQEACNWVADIIWINHLSEDEPVYKNIMKGIALI